MNSLPLEYTPAAADDVRGVAPTLLPAVLEHLTRIAANHATCSRPTAFPHPQGLESGVWVRHAGGAALVRVSFRLEALPDRIVIRRVVLTHLDRLPDWVLRPDEWAAHPPWPVVDL